MNLYFLLHSKHRKKYYNEIRFLNESAKKDFSYSYIFPYSFVFDYDLDSIKVLSDKDKGLFYVIHNDKKLYFKRDFQENQVKVAYYCSLIEQDTNSPHKYLNDNFKINFNDTVVDIGAAEATFSLEVIESINKLYVFESDEGWIEALEATFEPWKEKVSVINKYVSNIDDDYNTILDSIIGKTKVNFIKIDVEGAEYKIIQGAKKTLKNNNSLRIAICTYHRENDAVKLIPLLQKNKIIYKL